MVLFYHIYNGSFNKVKADKNVPLLLQNWLSVVTIIDFVIAIFSIVP